MKSEKWFSQTLRKKIPESLGIKFWSFEWCGYADVPDLYCVTQFGCQWFELKVVGTLTQKIPFRKGQQMWLREHNKAGGRAYVLVWVDKTQTVVVIPDYCIMNKINPKVIGVLGHKDVFCREISSAACWQELGAELAEL